MAKTKPFVSDIDNIRKRARKDIENGAMTAGYSADRATVVDLLNQALATELVCVLRYKYHYYMASGIHSQAIKAEFLQHANEEQGHADLIAERITQLEGKPNLSPVGLLDRSHADYVEGDDLVDMIKEDLVAERIAIDSYREMIHYVGTDDPTTRRVLEGILAMEEEHAEDMNTLLEQLGKKGEPAKPSPIDRRQRLGACAAQFAGIDQRGHAIEDAALFALVGRFEAGAGEHHLPMNADGLGLVRARRWRSR